MEPLSLAGQTPESTYLACRDILMTQNTYVIIVAGGVSLGLLLMTEQNWWGQNGLGVMASIGTCIILPVSESKDFALYVLSALQSESNN